MLRRVSLLMYALSGLPGALPSQAPFNMTIMARLATLGLSMVAADMVDTESVATRGFLH